MGGPFTANITVGGEPVSCIFRVLTEDAGSSTGTVQIGNGTASAIPNTTAGTIIIPSSVSNEGITYTVTKIGNYAFYRCDDLTGTLDIPATVTSIGSNAFYYCSGFTGTLNIPSSVTSIGNYSFAYCTSFSALRFNSADTLTSIGEGAFYDCSGLAGELDIPDSVTSIGFNAFNGCSGFTGPLIIPNSVTSIGDNAFVNCSGLTGPLTISDAVTSIGYMTFYGCSGFTGGLDIPNSVTSIGDFAFSGCTGFTGALTIPDSVTSIGDRTFENCTGFTGALTIPASVTSIGDYAFFNCRGFTGALTISNSVTSIGSSAFLNCSGFTGALTIPNSVTSIGAYAFYECTGFTGALTIPDSVTFIGNQAFYHCYSISALELQGDTLPATMGDDVFKNCSELNKLIVPATWIGGASVTLPGIAFLPFTGNKLIKDAGLDSVLGEALSTPAGGAGAAAGTPITWSIDVANDVTQVASTDIVPSTGSTAALYSNADFTANEGASITLTEGGATTAYIKVAGGDTRTVRYHAVTINHVAVVPGAPTSVTATAGDTQAIVSFTAPASNGGAAIIGYTVTSSPVGFTATGASSPITINGLTNGQAYTFTVTATNSVGTGAASTASNSVTPLAPPSSGGGGGGGTPALVTRIDNGGSVTGTNVANLVKEGKSLTVEGKTGEKLVFDTEALKNIDGQTKESLKVEIKDVSADHAAKHPDRLVVSLTVTAGGKHITNFGNGTATVSLPYELKPGEKAADVTVWYLAEDGSMTEVPCTYDPATKLATFKVNHFSLYVVGTADLSTWANPFSDVKQSDWFYDAVRYASANGLMQETKGTAFSPDTHMTRGMLVTILWRMENEPAATAAADFTDIAAGKWYTQAVTWAAKNEIVTGHAGKFNPDDAITREQLAAILHRYATYKDYAISKGANLDAYPDTPSDWALSSVSWAVAEGLLQGSGGRLAPEAGATRAQAATVLQRFIENIAN